MIKLNFNRFILYIILCSIGLFCPLYLLMTSKIDVILFFIMTISMGLIFTIITLALNYLHQNINYLENEIEKLNRRLDDKY